MTRGAFEIILILPFLGKAVLLALLFRLFRKMNRFSGRMAELNYKPDQLLQSEDRS